MEKVAFEMHLTRVDFHMRTGKLLGRRELLCRGVKAGRQRGGGAGSANDGED